MDRRNVSQFSATNIGLHDSGSSRDRDFVKTIFKEEANQVSGYLKGVHHVRKSPHMQVNYPDTITRLSSVQAQVPTFLQPPPLRDSQKFSSSHGVVVTKQREFESTRNSYSKDEHHLNQKKRYYNLEVARKAIVNGIISGTAPMPKDLLFPQRASHQSILNLTKTYAAPDARIVPPDVPRPRKWLGDDKGWSDR